MKSYSRSNYLSDSGILAGNFDRSGSLSTNDMWTGVPQQQTRTTHSGQSHRSCLDVRWPINTVEYLSIYSKDYLHSYTLIIYTPVSSFGTKKRQRVLTVCMAAGSIKGLIYLEARACFSVHSGIRLKPRSLFRTLST